MGIFGKLFTGKPRPPTPADEIRKIIDRFATATIVGVDPEELGRYPAMQYKTMAFHYGAIEYLCGLYDFNETETLGIFVVFIDKYFNMPITETGSISERLNGFRNNPEELKYLDAGADVFHRWHEKGNRRAPLELGKMLGHS